MISKEQINNNKSEFIELLKTISREGADVENLINTLENSDFFVAPASTKYHGGYEGGLCDHCLNVYYNMMHLVKYKFPEVGDTLNESIIILALLHDLSKMNNYHTVSRNVKVYSEDGDKSDSTGKFYWDTETSYALRDASSRFIFGSHEMTAEYLVSKFIPLTVEESVAILHHMGGMGWDSAQDNITEVYNKYPLCVLLHLADMMSCYIDERMC